MRILGYTLIKTSTLELNALDLVHKASIGLRMVTELLACNHALSSDRCDWCGRAKSKTPKGRGSAI